MNRIKLYIGLLLLCGFTLAQDCRVTLCLFYDNIDPTAGSMDILYNSLHDISGFQFNLEGIDLLSVETNLDNISFNQVLVLF